MDDSNRSGQQRIPPGQYKTDKWPVLTYGEPPELDLESFELRIFGEVERGAELSWVELQDLPRTEVVADFHCVTRFSTIDNVWSGFSTHDVLMQAVVKAEASHVMVHCAGGYTTNLPLEDFLSERALIELRNEDR